MRGALAALLAAGLLAACLVPGGARAQPRPATVGEPVTDGPLRDPDFGVRTSRPGLQRRVEMYQWRKAADGYARVWSTEAIPSAGHDAQHANPGAFPIRTRYWVARRVTLDGRPLQEDVLKEFGGWREFRPGFTALPGNLAATFQPEGDGLSSAENPLDPQIGDLRITWRELVLPPLAGKVALEGGMWVAAAAQTGDTMTPEQGAAVAAKSPLRPAWLLGGACVLAVLVFGLALRRRSKRRRS